MNYLLIDDLANNGWTSILEKAVIKENNSLDVAVNYSQAVEKLKREWNIIFLDMRLTELDHNVQKIEDYSGFKILKEIRKEFNSINFCTPIILITASNKIWNVNAFQENGIDGYYIKEHPDNQFDKLTSQKNLNNLQDSFKSLILKGRQRREIWNICNSIIEKVSDHTYFKTQEKHYVNIRKRIIDKIKLGYAQLFQTQTTLEKQILLSYNESLSFIIFWSILEEISKGFTKINETWNTLYERNSNWKFNNGDYFIFLENNELQLNFGKEDNGDYVKKVFKFPEYSYEFKKYTKNSPISLSDQIYSLLSSYSINNGEYRKLWQKFKPLNRYRNETDFIHGSVINILQKKLLEEDAIKEAYEMNVKILKFIDMILNINVK
jgi:CheY-like chemotaxis protein